MAGTVASTKREVRSIYFSWPGRRDVFPGKSILFQEYLRSHHRFSGMHFAGGDIFQVISGWIEEWDGYLI